MTSRLASGFVLPALLLVACGGSSTKKDMATGKGDMAMSLSGDMQASGACTTVATWPTTDLDFEGGTDGDTVYQTTSKGGTLEDLFEVDNFVGQTPMTTPFTYTITANDQFASCATCVSFSQNYDPNATVDNSVFYFAQAGTVTVEQSDTDPIMGTFHVKGANIHMVEWSFYDQAASDSAIVDGRCYDVGAFEFNGQYLNTPDDGGTDDM